MEKTIYVVFGFVAVASLLAMVFAFQPSSNAQAFYQPITEMQKDCKYQCAVWLHNCREQAAESLESCNQPLSVCIANQRALEIACNNDYWGCRAKCSQEPGAGLAAFRR